VPDNSAWLEKYSEEIDAQFGDAAKFAETYSATVRPPASCLSVAAPARADQLRPPARA
jgi:hypothetical protein